MNLRALGAALYAVVFVLNLINFTMIPSELFRDLALVIFGGLVGSLMGILLAIWIYQDGENIKVLHSALSKLEAELNLKREA